MLYRRYFCITLIVFILLSSTAFARGFIESDLGEATVKVGDRWRLITPAYFDATNCDIVERSGYGIKFTQVGTTKVTAYFFDQMSERSNKRYKQTKTFHVVASDEYGESINKSVEANNYAETILNIFNKERQVRGLEPLMLDPELCSKAEKRAARLRLHYGMAELFENVKVPYLLDDPNYKYIQEKFTFDIWPRHENVPEVISNMFLDSGDDSYEKVIFNKKSRYLGIGFVSDSEGKYTCSILFADKK